MMRRPLFSFSITMMTGVVLTSLWQYLPIAFAAVLFIKGIDRKKGLLMLIIAFYLGSAVFLLDEISMDLGRVLDSEAAKRITGKVKEIEKRDEGYYRLKVKVSSSASFQGQSFNSIERIEEYKIGNRLLQLNYYSKLNSPEELLGRTISFTAQVSGPSRPSNPGGFNQALYLRSKGIGHVAETRSIEVINPEKAPRFRLKMHLIRLREGFLESLNADEPTEGVIRGMLFGDTGMMDEGDLEDFRTNATAHILAVSGPYVSILGVCAKSESPHFQRFRGT